MIFKDPIRTIQVEVPAGWAFDPFNSTLTDFVFSRWDQPHEMIAVHVRRASVPSGQPDEEWIGKIRAETGEAASLTDLPSDHGRAVAVEFKSSRGWAQRVAFVRGPRVEMVIEQRSAMQAEQNVWGPLERAVRTAASAANLELPEDFKPEEFNRSVEAVNLAFEKDDHYEVERALQKSIDIGTSAWLHSMAMPDRALEINAAVRMAQATAHLGLFTGEPFLVRDADFLLRRAQHALEAAGIGASWAQELGEQISEALHGVWAELLDQAEQEGNASMSPILSLRERGFRSTNAAARAFEDHDSENALALAGMAVEDILSLIAFLRQNPTQEIPEEIATHLSEQGITDKEQQKEAIQKARETLLFQPLNMAIQIRHCCALERGDVEAATETVAVRVPLAKLILDSNPQDASMALNLALAMMDCAGAAAFQPGPINLDEASGCLDEALRILDMLREHPSSDGSNIGWTHFHKNQTDAALKALDRSLAATEQGKDDSLAQRLSELCAQFKTVAARFQEAAAKA
jgi:hypothetical protein